MFRFDLTNLDDNELREALNDMLDLALSAKGDEFRMEVVCYDRSLVFVTPSEAIAFREGFIMAKILTMLSIADEPWKKAADKSLN